MKKKTTLSWELVYILLEKELEVLRKYLETIKTKNWIYCFTSLGEIFIIFVLKKNSKLYFYIDYRDINHIIIKNKTLLFLINKILN